MNLLIEKYHQIIIVLISFLFFLCINHTDSYAQKRNLDTQILVYILPDSLELPAEEKRAVSLSRATIPSTKLANALQQLPVRSVGKTFPYWDNKDTVRVRKDGKRVKVPRFSRVFTFTFPSKLAADAAIERLSKEPSVLYAEPHMDAKLFNDPDYSDQWHLNNTGQSTGGTVDADIDAPEAWQIFTGNSSIKIGVFDTGVDLSYDDFSGKISGDNISSSGFESSRFHGTHVAGIAAAKANNGKAGRGVD